MNFFNRYQQPIIFLGILIVAANLRASITSVGIVLPQIRETFALSEWQASVIGMAPLIAFGIMSSFVPSISRRFGVEQAIFYGLFILLFGLILRSYTQLIGFMIGTFILGAGIQFGNVLMPGYIKANFPAKIGVLTGLYSASMNLTSAVFAQVTGPMSLTWGWRHTLILPASLTVLALLIWGMQFFFSRKEDSSPTYENHSKSSATTTNVWRSSLAWMVTIFMGMQSFQYYTAVNWFPEYYMDRGLTVEAASSLIALMQMANIVASFGAPVIIARAKSSRPFVIGVILSAVICQLGMIFGSNEMMWIFALMFGINAGFFFALVTLWFSFRTANAYDAAQLSGMAQGVGYFIAALGPFLFGSLFGWTGSWTASFLMMFLNLLVLLIAGLGASQNKVI